MDNSFDELPSAPAVTSAAVGDGPAPLDGSFNLGGVDLGSTKGIEAPLDPFAPERFRIAGASARVKKVTMSIPVGRPHPAVFIRVHAEPSFQLDTGLLVLKAQNERYIVPTEFQHELMGEPLYRSTRLYVYVTRQGTLGVWDVRLPNGEGSLDSWNASAHEIARCAMTAWGRVISNMEAAGYDLVVPEVAPAEPDWPPMSMGEILRTAFRNHIIDTHDHPVLRQLRGAQ